ncbi:MAG TPA: DUF3261 domain-containing protein [Alphaproteobacteria bacterium]|nr:DUF3261 domain-containing protein [Alphaproteobacteria bacterium]
MSRDGNERAGRLRWGDLLVRAFVVFALLPLVAGCVPPRSTVVEGPIPENVVQVAPKTAIVMPRPRDLARSINAVQHVTAHYGNQTFVFDNRISITPDRVRLVSLDSSGNQAMTITWTSGGVYSEAAAWIPEPLRPEKILADMVILYWPEESVRIALIGGTLHAAPEHRSVVADGQDVIRAAFNPLRAGDPWSGSLHYENVALGYAVDIQSREQR